jgi:hypothetical protein
MCPGAQWVSYRTLNTLSPLNVCIMVKESQLSNNFPFPEENVPQHKYACMFVQKDLVLYTFKKVWMGKPYK